MRIALVPFHKKGRVRFAGNEENMGLLIFLFWITLNGRLTWEIAGLGAVVTGAAFVFLCLACDWSLKKETTSLSA